MCMWSINDSIPIWLLMPNPGDKIIPLKERFIIVIIGFIVIAILLYGAIRFFIKYNCEERLRGLHLNLFRVEKENEKLKDRLGELKEKLRKKSEEISRVKEDTKGNKDVEKQLKEQQGECKRLKEYVRKLEKENEALKRELDEKEVRAREAEEQVPELDEEHFGDNSYWTGERLHELKKGSPEMSYREMESKTGIKKSTVQRRINKYLEMSKT